MTRTYTDTHEWIEEEGSTATVGLCQYAVHELGEIVYVELPKVGGQVKQGQMVAVLESTKAAIDLHSPLEGTVAAVNTRLKDEVQLLNHASESDGWLYTLAIRKQV